MALLRFIVPLLVFCTSLRLPLNVQAQGGGCDCGYKDPLDPTGRVWTTYWQSDFTTMSRQELQNEFNIMTYSVQHPGGASRDFQANNVAIDGTGLHLTVHPKDGNNVPSAGIYTKR